MVDFQMLFVVVELSMYWRVHVLFFLFFFSKVDTSKISLFYSSPQLWLNSIRAFVWLSYYCFARCYARLHPRAVNCWKKKCGHSNQVIIDICLCHSDFMPYIWLEYFILYCDYCLVIKPCTLKTVYFLQLRPKKKIKWIPIDMVVTEKWLLICINTFFFPSS